MSIVSLNCLAALVVATIATPALAGAPTSISAPTFQTGDSWVYDRANEKGTSGFSRQRLDLTIERVDTDTMIVGIKPDGAPGNYQDHISGLDWSQRRVVAGQQTVTGRPFNFPLTVGSTWEADYVEPRPSGLQTFAHFHTTYKVVGWEDVVVPAGTFHVLKIEAKGMAEGRLASPAMVTGGAVAGSSGSTSFSRAQKAQSEVIQNLTYAAFYYAPEVRYFVKSVEEQSNSENVLTSRDTQNLVSFKVRP
jgi:hypothetical protein